MRHKKKEYQQYNSPSRDPQRTTDEETAKSSVTAAIMSSICHSMAVRHTSGMLDDLSVISMVTRSCNELSRDKWHQTRDATTRG